MLLAVRIRLEGMNVTASRVLLDATVKQVDTIYFFFLTFHFRTFLKLFPRDDFTGTPRHSFDKS